jgi:hypothetical protein
VRSRPTWRVFCYSAEEPPLQRGLVLVDAVDGRVLQHLAEPNPELDHHIEAAARVDAGDEEPD